MTDLACLQNKTLLRPFFCIIQIIHTAGESKTDSYISSLYKKVMADINLHAPDTSVSGFVMDCSAANRAAIKLLDADEDLPPLVCLQCASNALSLLLKDLSKRFEWSRAVYADALFISSTINSTESMRHLFEMEVMKSGGRSCSILTHCDTRFGSQYIVALSISKHIDSLVAMCRSAPFLQLLQDGKESAVKLHAILVVECTHQDGFVRRLPILEKLCQPMYASMLIRHTCQECVPLLRSSRLMLSGFIRHMVVLAMVSSRNSNVILFPFPWLRRFVAVCVTFITNQL
jgi:hypothetical protein